MIQINLLPHEYRKTESTPVARFIAIVVGAVIVTSGLVAYGFVHYSKLKSIQDVREATEQEFGNKKKQADISKSLQAEINAYESRRRAIQKVARARILQSRKLDEFLDIIHNRGDRSNYFVWLRSLAVKPARSARKGKATTGGVLSFSGYSESLEFSRITNLRDAIKKDAFYEDFSLVSQPGFKAIEWDDELEPKKAGKFSFSLTFKPLGWRFDVKGGKKRGK